MKVLVVPDSMKDALTATRAASIIQQSILQVFPEAEVTGCPFSDGGEGMVEVLASAGKGKRHTAQVEDALGRLKGAQLLELEEGVYCIEMAQASGLEHLKQAERNPLHTTTRGVGQLIKRAVSGGAHTIYLGMGGSATHDLGCGMAHALGVKFYNKKKEEILPTGNTLTDIQSIDFSGQQELRGISFYGVSDVSNLLLGEEGAAQVFAKQKGASDADIKHLEEGSKHVMRLLSTIQPKLVDSPGMGAAGGLGFGLVTFLKGSVLSGVEVMSNLFSLEEKISLTDIVITLEGKTDLQTLKGKAPFYVGRLSAKHKKTTLHFTGSWNAQLVDKFSHVFDLVIPIQDQPMDVATSMARTEELLSQAVVRTFTLIRLGQLFQEKS